MEMESPTALKSAIIIYALTIILTISSVLINANSVQQEQSASLIIILGLIFMTPYVVLGYFIYRQKKWARLVYSILYVLGIISQITLHQIGGYNISVLYINILLGVIIILLYMPKSNACFNK